MPEELLGVIPVTAKLTHGSERLTLVPTTSGIIVAHIGKRGAGAVVATQLIGRLGNAIEDLFKAGKESVGHHVTAQSDPEKILAADKDNFRINSSDIISVDVEAIGPVSRITMLTPDEKYSFVTLMKYDELVNLLDKCLGPKLTARRL